MPQLLLHTMDLGPAELSEQVPLKATALRFIAGPDRPDYLLVAFETPLRYVLPEGFDENRLDGNSIILSQNPAEERTVISVSMGLIATRVAGERLYEGCRNIPLNLAYVIDNSQAEDPTVNFSKLEYVAVVHGDTL